MEELMKRTSDEDLSSPISAADRALRMAAASRTSGALAHEIANYVGAITTWAYMLQEELGEGSQAREDVEGIVKAVAGANAFINELRAFAHPASLGPDRTDLNEVVRGLATRLRESLKAGGRLELKLADEALWVNGRVAALEPLVVDLVARAADALGEGGTVGLATSRLGPGTDPAPAGAAAGVRLEVRDDGRIPEADQLRRFFEPFALGRARASGLRLAVLFETVRENGGVAAVDASEGATRVVVDLPWWQPRDDKAMPVR
jgi:signal transduction histidine kinase